MTASSSANVMRDIRRAVLRHKKKSLICFMLIVSASTAAIFLLPKRYHSAGKLFVRLGRENATLDPTATLSQEPVVSVPQSRDNEINSIVEVLRSRVIAEKVVDALGPDFVLGKTPEPEYSDPDPTGWADGARRQFDVAVGRVKDWARRAELTPELSERDQAVLVLLDRYAVNPVRKANIVEIDCEGPSSEWAQAVVDTLIDLYQGEHVRLNRPQGSLDFFQQQADQSLRDLTRKEEELRDLKTATGLALAAEQRQAVVTRIARLDDELLQAEAARAVSQSKIQVLRQQAAALPEKTVSQETAGFGNEATDRMRDQLYVLEVKKEEAAAKYTEAHPHMQRLHDQLDSSRSIVEQQPTGRTQVTTATSRLHEEARLALMVEEPQFASLQAKAETTRAQLAAVRGELKGLNENELRIATLQRDVELQQASYRRYATNLEQARIDRALEEQRMSNISVVQPASFEPKPIYPRKAGLLGLGVVAGLFGALGLALWADWRDHRFHLPEDLTRRLDVAVLASIPRLRERDVRLTRNGRH